MLKGPKAHVGRGAMLAFCVSTVAFASAETVTEPDVVRITRAQDPQALAARASVLAAEAEEVRAALYPNASLSWEREHLPAGERSSQDAVFVTIPIDFGGSRHAESALARSGTTTARARSARSQTSAVTRSLSVFYAVLAAKRNAELLAQAASRLEEATRIVARRHEEGTTSGYERTRLELELELARSHLRLARATSRTQRATLATLLGKEPDGLRVRGDFTTRDPTTSLKREPASLRLWRAAEAHARDARGAARRAWIPALSLSGGLLIEDTLETRYGYVAGVSLALPIFSRGQETIAEAEARGGLAAAEARSAEREMRIEEVRGREELLAARAELAHFDDATRERVELLERAALSGYREGGRSVVELVDAQRARTEIERRRLELELMAKQAELALRAAQGEFE